MENEEIVQNGDSNQPYEDPNLKIVPTDENNTENINENKLRGDAIGNTVYSERYVLETLLKLRDNRWNKEIEDDLCCIWDMTLDKDVVNFLLDNSFIDFAITMIKQSNELRLIEILVGIIANMCIEAAAAEKTTKSIDFDVLLSLVFSGDRPTLIQIMRLLKSLLYNDNIDCKLIMTDDILNQVNFILCSAKNTELLGYTLQVCGEITNKDRNIFMRIPFLESISEAFQEIIDYHDYRSENYLDQELEKHLSTYLKVIENVCSLITDENDSNKIKEYISKFSTTSIQNNTNILQLYLEQYASQKFLLQESKSIEYFIYCTVNFLISFQTGTNDTIFNYFIALYQNIVENKLKATFETDVCEYISNYFVYFVESTNLDNLKVVLKNYTKDYLKQLFLNDVIVNYDCTQKFKNIINELLL